MTVVVPPDADAATMAKMGYKQELRRNFSMLEVFGLAFSIMGPLPSIASTLPFSMLAGPAAMVWGWFIASGFIFVVGMAMSDLGSAMPTSGGLYWWTHHFASPRSRNYLSFLVGYSNTLGLVGGLCSVDYGLAKMICSVVTIATDGAWKPSEGILFLVFFVSIVTHAVLVSTLSTKMGKIQSFSLAMNVLAILATLVALPVGRSKRDKLETSLNILHVENATSWPAIWSFMLSWISPIWSIGGFASCVNVAEEAANAPKAVPVGILLSIGNAWVIGFIIQLVLVSSMKPDMGHYLNSPTGQPMTQIYYDAVGKSGCIVLMVILCIVQFLMGLSVLVSASRQSWAFSRDGALPFSRYLSRISTSLGHVPFRAIWACAAMASIFGLLSLIDPAAAQALFSLPCAANNVAWAIPIMSRVVWGQKKFVPGPIYTGWWSQYVAWGAVTFLAFGVIISFFPTAGPNTTASTMNYTVVVNGAVWVGASAYYFIDARKWFTGPKTTASDEDTDGTDTSPVNLEKAARPRVVTSEQQQSPSYDGSSVTMSGGLPSGETTPMDAGEHAEMYCRSGAVTATRRLSAEGSPIDSSASAWSDEDESGRPAH